MNVFALTLQCKITYFPERKQNLQTPPHTKSIFFAQPPPPDLPVIYFVHEFMCVHIHVHTHPCRYGTHPYLYGHIHIWVWSISIWVWSISIWMRVCCSVCSSVCCSVCCSLCCSVCCSVCSISIWRCVCSKSIWVCSTATLL